MDIEAAPEWDEIPYKKPVKTSKLELSYRESDRRMDEAHKAKCEAHTNLVNLFQQMTYEECRSVIMSNEQTDWALDRRAAILHYLDTEEIKVPSPSTKVPSPSTKGDSQNGY